MPALRPLESLKTSSTVRGLYGGPPSMPPLLSAQSVETCGADCSCRESVMECGGRERKRGGKVGEIFDL